MSEKLSNSPEQREQSPEALENAGVERRAELEAQHERAVEDAPEKNVERLSKEALEKASPEKETRQERSPAEKRKDTPLPRKLQEKVNFTRTMQEARGHMSAPSRTFSKVIHTPVVEKTSEAVGSTIARPNAILAGSLTAFIFTLALYLIARYYGYPLSGFETIGAFILGWVIGIMFDYLRVMITGRRG